MFKRSLLSPRYYLLGAVLMAVPALAQAQAPSQEFWDHVEEYGDANGNVLDPLEYDQITNIKTSEKLAPIDAPPANEHISIEKNKGRNADMKFEQRSSAASSVATTSTIKGATL